MLAINICISRQKNKNVSNQYSFVSDIVLISYHIFQKVKIKFEILLCKDNV